MLRANLATRPFYNERIVHAILLVCALAVAAATIYNIQQLVSLSRRVGALNAQAARDESRARELRRSASSLRASLKADEIEAVVSAAREANTLIDRRTFSWTALLNQLERTLPSNVMLTAVRPIIRDGQVKLTLIVVGRTVDDLEQFMRRLEDSGAFGNVLSVEEAVQEDGNYKATLVGDYRPVEPTEPARENASTTGASQEGG